MINGTNAKTIPHEIGHTGGLRHPNMDYATGILGLFHISSSTNNSPNTNFMNQGSISNPTGPTKSQIERIYRLYTSGYLNKSYGSHPIYTN